MISSYASTGLLTCRHHCVDLLWSVRDIECELKVHVHYVNEYSYRKDYQNICPPSCLTGIYSLRLENLRNFFGFAEVVSQWNFMGPKGKGYNCGKATSSEMFLSHFLVEVYSKRKIKGTEYILFRLDPYYSRGLEYREIKKKKSLPCNGRKISVYIFPWWIKCQRSCSQVTEVFCV